MNHDAKTVMANLRANSHLLDDITDPKKLIEEGRVKIDWSIVDEKNAEIARLAAENHRLRAALLTWTFDNTSDDERTEFEYAIMELKVALSGEYYDNDMKCIAKFNHDNIDINEVE